MSAEDQAREQQEAAEEATAHDDQAEGEPSADRLKGLANSRLFRLFEDNDGNAHLSTCI